MNIPPALVMEIMAVLWAIAAIQAWQPEAHWVMKAISFITGFISIIYFIGSIIYKTQREPEDEEQDDV